MGYNSAERVIWRSRSWWNRSFAMKACSGLGWLIVIHWSHRCGIQMLGHKESAARARGCCCCDIWEDSRRDEDRPLMSGVMLGPTCPHWASGLNPDLSFTSPSAVLWGLFTVLIWHPGLEFLLHSTCQTIFSPFTEYSSRIIVHNLFTFMFYTHSCRLYM